MNPLPNPIFDQSWPLQDAAVLMFCLSVAIWLACFVMDLRQHATRPRPDTPGRADRPTGELQ
ncbi:hypothetical protein ACOCG7_19995 [Paraburkholderia sp. DD10]|jgi:hypothetical protein|uniref:Uncharacterized protein n=1 Tax=Paraburkholderia terricola TaxID=169427 RepID=A0A1M6INJ4_9BURK|nr:MULTISPECIES: hypothetical protein [Paraburkholderia]ORC49397.1 hypothetical protein B2G74_15395 [Burkholderia sp. A27]AXE92331.1 hypothetical protein CUJ90_08150 [Paraburkholderia terricola]MDR6408193.1 hypothetical protein [Paraburkholderia terricola]MDR6448820.1 hypothetical protein [Paraburkholderia terricola]MDR6481885.1 hypothetical protein [Paraburkholderia terricola]